MGDYIYQTPEPRKRFTQQQVDLGETISEAYEGLKSGFRRLFGVEEKTEVVDKVVATQQATSVAHCVTIGGMSIPQTYADYIESFYAQFRVYSLDFKTLYKHVPSVMVDKVLLYLPVSPAGVSDDTYESILRRNIEIAKEVNCNYVKAVDYILLFCIGWGGIQRTSLCVIWANLLFALFSKFTSTITENERKCIARGGIAFAFGVSIAIIQYFHKSPYGITNYLRLLYEGYNDIRDWCNQHFSFKIPDVLRLESPRKEFAKMTDDEKTTVGQMLNMVYTFRVGDMYLEVCSKSSKKNYLNDETISDMIDKGLSPLPERAEIERLYKLYTNEKLYDL
ncbi:MAG: hypothetical protein II817_01335 [Bacteroidales bacterium]|nr:hypothetical protein [Bacteroidales bacterium]